ncbi:MAG: HNH endonuclease [Candidatus Cloacimonetes bacterium]|nr:HNH endonuclease [Candidatus Cloacimonadota bacterium]
MLELAALKNAIIVYHEGNPYMGETTMPEVASRFMIPTIQEVSLESLKTINEDLREQAHPETGVPFIEKEIEIDGIILEGVFPEFESKYDAILNEDQYKETDAKQFDEANKQLSDAISKDPDLKSSFTNEQIEQIKNGDTPEGYTWHHNEEPGLMQLVKTEIHQKTAHTGGKSIWGGGSACR